MSLWQRELVRVGIAARHIVCAVGAESGAPRTVIDFDARSWEYGNNSAERLTAALDAALGANLRRARLEVVVSCEMSRHWIVEPPAGLSSLRELGAVAELRFAALFATDVRHWSLAGDWHASRPSLCAAMPRAFVDGLEALRVQHGVRYDIETALGAVLKRHGPALADGWCVIRTARTLILMRSSRGAICSMRSIPCDADVDPDARLRGAAVELRRELLRHGETRESNATWLDFAPEREHVTEAASLDVDGLRLRGLAQSRNGEHDALNLALEAERRADRSTHALEALP